MKVALLLVVALVACKPDKAAKPAAGSEAIAAPVAAPGPALAPVAAAKAAPAPQVASYIAPATPEGEVAPVQAGSAAAPHLVKHDPVARAYDQLDADHDGKVTPAEVTAGKLHLDDPAALDTDGDGQISRDELAAGLREQRSRARIGARR